MKDHQLTDSRTDTRNKHWVKLGITFLLFIGVSIGIGLLVQALFSHYKIPQNVPEWTALIIIFGIMFVINLSVLPLPFGISIMLIAAMHWNPIFVAIVSSMGACLGEFSGYFFGYLGKKIAIEENTPGYNTVQRWIHKYGMWAIVFLSFQPIIPFEIGGFAAGVAKMSVRSFLPALWIGKLPKYLIIIYLGTALFNFIPGIK